MNTQAAPPAVQVAQIKKTDDGHWYVHGGLSFQIDTEDLGKALQQADDMGEGPAKELMSLNGMPVDPWSFRLARPVVLSYVQLVWHRHKGQPEEALARLVDKLKNREEHYQQEVKKLASKPPKPAKALSDAIRGGGSRTTPQHAAGKPYTLRQDRKEVWEKFSSGQKKILIDKMLSHGKPVSSSELAKLLEADGFKATQPVERVTAFYFGEWRRNGLLEEHVAEPAPAGSAPAPKEPPADASKLDTTKKNGGSKKKK